MSEPVRPTKKQRELLDYIEAFITEHGYSPSYREIMNGLQYSSVATVALHVGNLIKRGHLRKRDHSARSLEVVRVDAEDTPRAGKDESAHEQWLLQKVNERLNNAATSDEDRVTNAETLLGALRLLGLQEPAERLGLQLQKAE